jgi:hypothetical protein
MQRSTILKVINPILGVLPVQGFNGNWVKANYFKHAPATKV